MSRPSFRDATGGKVSPTPYRDDSHGPMLAWGSGGHGAITSLALSLVQSDVPALLHAQDFLPVAGYNKEDLVAIWHALFHRHDLPAAVELVDCHFKNVPWWKFRGAQIRHFMRDEGQKQYEAYEDSKKWIFDHSATAAESLADALQILKRQVRSERWTEASWAQS